MNRPDPDLPSLDQFLSSQRSPDDEGPELPTRQVERAVPFSDFIDLSPPTYIKLHHLAAGLASALTTTVDNPYFKLPSPHDERSGALPAAFAMYAPYYIGTGMTAEEIADDVAEQAAAFLARLDREHNYDGYVGRMMSVLRRGDIAERGLQAIEDRNILYDVHDFLALITHRLRLLSPHNTHSDEEAPPAEQYRHDTHARVDPYVHSVRYADSPQGIVETFLLPEYVRSSPGDLVALGWDFFKSWSLRRGAEFAALAAATVANPLVRDALEEHYRAPGERRRDYLQGET